MNKNNGIVVFILILIVFLIFEFILLMPNEYVVSASTDNFEGISYIKRIVTSPLFIIILIFAIILIITFTKYNKMIALKLKSEQAEKTIDVYLKQRFDLIPNIVETVKAYSKYEQETLNQVIELRKKYMEKDTITTDEAVEADNKCNSFLAQIEAYPELKASEAYLILQQSLSKVESQLQAARRIYNMETTNYNIYISKFPSTLIAGLFSFEEKCLFQAIDAQKVNVPIK